MLYPLISIPANIIYARFITNLNLGFIILSVLALMNTVIKYLPNTDIQFLMYFLWVPWRACAFTFYFAAFQRVEINKNYIITLTTLGLTTGGLLSLLTAVWNILVEEVFGGSFLHVNIGMDSLNFFTHILLLLFFNVTSKKKE